MLLEIFTANVKVHIVAGLRLLLPISEIALYVYHQQTMKGEEEDEYEQQQLLVNFITFSV